MAVKNWFLGKLRSKINRPTGVIIAPPRPCSARVNTSIAKLSAIPQRHEPTVKVSNARVKIFRAPKRSAEPATHRDEDCQRQDIGGHRQVHSQRRRAEVSRHIWNSGRDDR